MIELKRIFKLMNIFILVAILYTSEYI